MGMIPVEAHMPQYPNETNATWEARKIRGRWLTSFGFLQASLRLASEAMRKVELDPSLTMGEKEDFEKACRYLLRAKSHAGKRVDTGSVVTET